MLLYKSEDKNFAPQKFMKEFYRKIYACLMNGSPASIIEVHRRIMVLNVTRALDLTVLTGATSNVCVEFGVTAIYDQIKERPNQPVTSGFSTCGRSISSKK